MFDLRHLVTEVGTLHMIKNSDNIPKGFCATCVERDRSKEKGDAGMHYGVETMKLVSRLGKNLKRSLGRKGVRKKQKKSGHISGSKGIKETQTHVHEFRSR